MTPNQLRDAALEVEELRHVETFVRARGHLPSEHYIMNLEPSDDLGARIFLSFPIARLAAIAHYNERAAKLREIGVEIKDLVP